MSDLGGGMLLLAGGVPGLLALLELRHRLRPASPVRMEPGPWGLRLDENQVRLQLQVVLVNAHAHKEVMVAHLWAEPTMLATQAVDRINVKIRVTPDHPDPETRPDGYWPVSILKPHQHMAVRLELGLGGDGLSCLQALWLEVGWLAYGPFGHLQQRHGLVVPLARPAADQQPTWRQGAGGHQVLPVATHLLGWLDDPLQVLRDYAAPHLQPGDVVALAETPLAVMQGRYRLGTTVEPSCLARQLCRVFHPHSSLATACGLQALIDLVGPARVLCAWLGGVLLRLLGIRGGFYRLAGEQARLIDDLTGTIPPYDRTIVLGPERSQALVTRLAQALGQPVVVVDVNDLGRVKIVARSGGVNPDLVHGALAANPAGNASEGTPLVLIRPCPSKEFRP